MKSQIYIAPWKNICRAPAASQFKPVNQCWGKLEHFNLFESQVYLLFQHQIWLSGLYCGCGCIKSSLYIFSTPNLVVWIMFGLDGQMLDYDQEHKIHLGRSYQHTQVQKTERSANTWEGAGWAAFMKQNRASSRCRNIVMRNLENCDFFQ